MYRGCEYIPEIKGTMIAQQREPGSHRAGHDGGKQAGAWDGIKTEGGESLDSCTRGGGTLAADDLQYAVRFGHKDRNVATRPVHVRHDDLQGECGGGGCIESVAPELKHPHSGLRSNPMRRRDYAEAADDLRSRRERYRCHAQSPALCLPF
jgi:hypothetical protein